MNIKKLLFIVVFGLLNSITLKANQTHYVEVGSYFFNPDVLNVHVGDTVMWFNTATINHTSTSTNVPTGATGWHEPLSPGDSAGTIVSVEGLYDYHCAHHPTSHSGSFTAYEMPGIPLLVSPPDMSNNVSVLAQFSWEEDENSDNYHLQVSENSQFTTTVINENSLTDTQFTAAANDLNYGATYYWQVRGQTAAGPGSWSGTWTFDTEILDEPDPIILYSPPDMSNDISRNPEFIWYEDSIADEYEFQLAKDSNFNALVANEIALTDTTFVLSNDTLDYDSTYFWRVRGSNDAGQGHWSEIWSFNILELQSPDTILLYAPPNLSNDVSLNPEFTWFADSLADYYELQLAEDSNFNAMIANEIALTDTTFVLSNDTLDYDSTYFWRVRGSNDAGQGHWSEIWSFNTLELQSPDTISLYAPPNLSNDVSLNPEFTWFADSLADYYELQLAEDSNFNAMIANEIALTDTTFVLSNDTLDYDSTYFWRVRGSNDAGQGHWSEIWSFNTRNFPDAIDPVKLYAPENMSTDHSLQVEMRWYSEPNSVLYELQVATDIGFNELVVNETAINDTQSVIEENTLKHDSTYYWRVRGKNNIETGEWSSIWSFKTEPLDPPATILLFSPMNNAQGLSTEPEMKWYPEDLADNYELQIAIDNNFENLLIDETNITDTSFTVTEQTLSYNSTYYWRVRGNNETGSGEWSEIWNFETLSTPAPVILNSPSNMSTGLQTETELTWFPEILSNEYELEVAKSIDFNNLLIEETISDTHYTITETVIDYENTYYWRVRGNNEAGAGEWSEIWTFETETINSLKNFHTSEELLNIYPNPARGKVFIEVTIKNRSNPYITLYTLNGVKLKSISENRLYDRGTHSFELSLINIDPGTYIIAINKGNTYKHKKINVK